MRKTAAKRLADSRRGKMIPLGCNMYVVLKVQNGNGSRLVIVFLLSFLYFYPIFFLYILLKYFLNQFIKWYECQKVFWHSFDTRIATQLRCSRNPPNIRNPLIYYVNRYFLIFGVSQVQKPYRASTNSFLTFWHWYHIMLSLKSNFCEAHCYTESEER